LNDTIQTGGFIDYIIPYDEALKHPQEVMNLLQCFELDAPVKESSRLITLKGKNL
jgi:hypothetical protein